MIVDKRTLLKDLINNIDLPEPDFIVKISGEELFDQRYFRFQTEHDADEAAQIYYDHLKYDLGIEPKHVSVLMFSDLRVVLRIEGHTQWETLLLLLHSQDIDFSRLDLDHLTAHTAYHQHFNIFKHDELRAEILRHFFEKQKN